MLNDYHMHFEYGSYTDEFVNPFFEQAKSIANAALIYIKLYILDILVSPRISYGW